MFARLLGKPGMLALASATFLSAAFAGCGGSPTDQSDMNVVVPEAGTSVSTKGTPATTAAPGGGTPVAEKSTAAAAAPSGSAAGGWGTFKGRVVFDGSRAAPKVLQDKGKAAKDPEICAVNGPIVSEQLVVDSASSGVKNVLVYFPRPTAVNDDAKKAMLAKNVNFDQQKCVFEPHVLGMMVGETVTLKSSDNVNHNVNVKLKQTQFNNIVTAAKAQPIALTGGERTPGAIICDIHPWMSAWWMVIDNPYITVTDEKGNFEIPNVPAGAQKVVVWQESVKGGGFVTAPSGEEVTIKADDATVKEFKIDSSKLLPGI